MNRVGTVFHESFSLNRPAISQILEIASNSSGKVDFNRIRNGTNLGNNYVKAMPRYAVGAGLLAEKSYRLTSFGQHVYQHDPNLNHPSTQWLMHYHLSAPLGPGPLFWHFLVTRNLFPGKTLDRPVLIKSAQNHLLETDGKELNERSARTLITVFLGTYSKPDGFGKLGLLTETSSGFTVVEPTLPNQWVIGYALAHYWASTWPQFRQIELDALEHSWGFTSLFPVSRSQLHQGLKSLQTEGLLELVQVAPPYQILQRWQAPDVFLAKIYE